MLERRYYVYILTNRFNKVLYTGVTNNLIRRLEEHINSRNPESFTAKYKVNKLVYFEIYTSAGEAILREKLIKGGSRKNKLALIEKMNPDYKDLKEELLSSLSYE
jgi:putative endonuclease